jgi:hypothetical protein
VKRDRALLQVAGQRRGWGKARQQWHFYLGLLGSERVGGGGGGRRPGRGGGERPQHLATHLLLLNPVRAELWVGGGGLTRSRGWGTPPLGPWPGLAISRSRRKGGSQERQNSRCARMCLCPPPPPRPSGTKQAGEQIGVGRRRLPAGLRSFREAGFPEALRRPGSSQATRRVARLASRLGAAGEPGAPHTRSTLSLADALCRRGGLSPALHLPAPRTDPPYPHPLPSPPLHGVLPPTPHIPGPVRGLAH